MKKILYITCSIFAVCVISLTVFCCVLAGSNSKLKKQNAENETQIETLCSKNSSLEKELSKLKTLLNETKAELATETDKTTELEGKVNELEQKISYIEALIASGS